MQTYRLAFYLGRRSENPKATRLDNLICAATRSRYSHVEAVIDYNPQGKSRTIAASPRDGGVRLADIDLQSGRWEVCEVWADSDFLDLMMLELGKPYHYLGALGSLIHIAPKTDKKRFCSGLVALCLRYSKAHQYTPGELYQALDRRAAMLDYGQSWRL
jgi:hypothetical protein